MDTKIRHLLNHSAPKQFVKIAQLTGAAVFAAGICLGTYAYTVDRLIPGKTLPATYKSLILSEVPGPRLIIESGSNSHHSLDAYMMSQELGLTVINVADNAGYDIESKVARMSVLAKPGDRILLPLEWSYYSRNSLTDDFVKTLFGPSQDYYQSLSPAAKTRFAISIPPKILAEQIFRGEGKGFIERDGLSQTQHLYYSALQSPNGSFSPDQTREPSPGVSGQTCDSYVFGNLETGNKLQISAKMKRALLQLAELKARNIDVMFAWPAVAGDGCMTSSQSITDFRDTVENTVEEAGFQFIGTAISSVYPLSLQDDTPYHLTTEGMQKHTKKMIRFLKAAGINGTGEGLDLRKFVTERIYELETAALSKPKIQPLQLEQELIIGSGTTHDHVKFAAGWWPKDPYGILMRDNRAVIGISIPGSAPENASIVFSGLGIAKSNYVLDATYKGAVLARGNFSTDTPLALSTRDLPRETPLWIHLNLPQAGRAVSPKERGENLDERTSTLRINSIKLSTAEPLPDPALITEPDAIFPPISEIPLASVLSPDQTHVSALSSPIATDRTSKPASAQFSDTIFSSIERKFSLNSEVVGSSSDIIPKSKLVSTIDGLTPIPIKQYTVHRS